MWHLTDLKMNDSRMGIANRHMLSKPAAIWHSGFRTIMHSGCADMYLNGLAVIHSEHCAEAVANAIVCQ